MLNFVDIYFTVNTLTQDRRGKCAGNHATDGEHWDVVNLLVEAGTKAEVRCRAWSLCVLETQCFLR